MRRKDAGGVAVGIRDHGGVLRGGISRARFLKLAGLGAGLSLFPGSMFSGNVAVAQVFGGPEILDPNGPYPIGLWWPPPPEQTSNERYAEISAAGFNFVIGGNGVNTDNENLRALNAASANGLRFLLTDSRLRRFINSSTSSAAAASTSEAGSPSLMRYLLEQEGAEASSRTASGPGEREGTYSAAASTEDEVKLRIQELLDLHAGNPALAGLNLYDEPGSGLFQILGVAREKLRQAPGELPYANVWPSYASPSALGTATYEDYLDSYMKTVQPPLLCFDHYPLLSGGGITGDYFHNWATIRKASLQFGVPSWVFIQSVGFDSAYSGFQDRRRPNEAEIRWQVNVSLAYGAKGIQHFTYWTPDSQPDDLLRFGQALIALDGTQTTLYDYAKKVNAYLGVMGKALLPLVSESVVHAREERLPLGAKPFKADGYVSAVSGSPLILGRFLRPGVPDVRYFFVTNRSLARVAESRLALSRPIREVHKLDIETDEFVRVSPQAVDGRRYLRLKLAPGEARLYRLHT